MKLTKYMMALTVSAGLLIPSFHTTALAAGDTQTVQQGEYKKDELVVQWKAYVSPAQRAAVFQKWNMQEAYYISKNNYSVIKIKGGQSVPALIARLVQQEQVLKVEPNYKLKQMYVFTDPYAAKQWHLAKLNLPKAWDVTKGSSEIKVALIDGAVQTNHPDLAGRFTGAYDVVSKSAVLPAADDHGTHVAGIVGAAGDGKGIVGIAPGVKLMPINVFYEDGYTSAAEVASAIMYAADHGANVINMSLGGYEYSSLMNSAVQYAASKGVVVVAAAGNEETSQPMYPAALSNVISVSAVTSSDRLAYFSNYGSTIDFAAPGDGIFSTIAGGAYASMSGTSMAAPMVSGTAALVLSRNPFLTPSQVYSRLKASALDLGAAGRDIYYGEGRIDAYKAVSLTPAPLTGFTVSTSRLVTDGRSSASITFQPYGSMDAAIYVTDAAGKTVRTLFSKHVTTEKIAASWDGKLTDGTYAKPGEYKVNLKVTNGKQTLTKSSALTVAAPAPSLKLSASQLLMNGVNKVKISFQKYSTMTASILVKDSSGSTVRTLAVQPGGTGSGTVYWEGKNSSQRFVKPGTYRVYVKITDGKRSFTQEVPLKAVSK
ncbi:S8 family serine peptidase [Ectobacillus ponti]|uniref:S8 family serine peptidase n=1 Tax=Ectobacillus ponti TaxID=2961894 RepID=A0AA41X3L6_9BACI|nr:S8 family serine peptidase [Ectobacillus ponti]MCP8968042.1 S8 family serine peptidase [Ectobacillus ponti]